MSGDRVLPLGGYLLDVNARSLTRDGQPVALPPKAVDTLILLVERQGQTVLKEELLERVWPDTFVEEGSLAQNISILRKTLGDWIRTVPKRGYCYVGPVGPPAAAKRTIRPLWLLGIAAVLIGSGVLLMQARRRMSPPPLARLLVLPVENLSGDAGHEFVSDGLTEELIAQLSTLDAGRLAVIARTSAMTYKGTRKSIGQIGRELRVDYVLESSLRWSGNQLRITSQLVRSQDESHVWAGSFDRTPENLLALQDEVAQAIALQIDSRLAGKSRRRQPQPQAYLAYLEGRYYWNKRTRQSLEQAMVHLRRAIALDPRFARAHSALADCYLSLGLLAGGRPGELFLKAKDETLQALALDPNLAEAHTSLAYLKFWQEWDWRGAESEFKRAIALNPDYATAHQWYAEYLRLMGRFDESIAESNRALALDPLSLVINMEAGLPYYYRRDYRRAREHFQRAIDLDPNFALAYIEMGWVYEDTGDVQNAIATFQKAAALDDTLPVLESLGHAYAMAGMTGEADRILSTLEERSKTAYVPALPLAALRLAVGDRERCFALLEKGYAD